MDLRPLGFTGLQPLPSLPVCPFPDASPPSPSAPRKFDDRKGNRKKFSCPSPGGRSASLLFRANPQSPWRHPEPGPMGARSAAAAGGWAGVRPVPPPRRPGPGGGREGTVPYKPWFSGLGRPRRLRFAGGGGGALVEGPRSHFFRPLLPSVPLPFPFPILQPRLSWRSWKGTPPSGGEGSQT